jgi:transcriptional regulator with XRE-family HTH domain
MTGLGNLIKEAREKMGVSQFYVASALGMSSSGFISRIERGERIPSLETTAALGQVLQIDLNQLSGELIAVVSDRILGELKVSEEL